MRAIGTAGASPYPNARPKELATTRVERVMRGVGAKPAVAATVLAVGALIAGHRVADADDGPAALRDPRFRSPMPGGVVAGYSGDTGLDIGGRHLPVFAIAAGTLDYSERGHTVWTTPPDTPLSVRITLDAPIEIEEPDPADRKKRRTRRVTHAYYTHMSALRFAVPECTTAPCPPPVHVTAGEPLGVSGVGNGSPHLHLGLLLDGDVSQTTWDTILREDRIRALLGGYRNGQRLP